jgi:hypothetical protein
LHKALLQFLLFRYFGKWTGRAETGWRDVKKDRSSAKTVLLPLWVGKVQREAMCRRKPFEYSYFSHFTIYAISSYSPNKNLQKQMLEKQSKALPPDHLAPGVLASESNLLGLTLLLFIHSFTQ